MMSENLMSEYLMNELFRIDREIQEKKKSETMKERTLESIKKENEGIINFNITSDYYNTFQLLFDRDLNEENDIAYMDIQEILEYTLNRMLEENFTPEEILSNSGMYIPSEKELEELEEYEEYVTIDLCYILGGLILNVKIVA